MRRSFGRRSLRVPGSEQVSPAVTRASELFGDDSSAYRRRVVLAGLVGYGYVLLVVAVLLGVVGGMLLAAFLIRGGAAIWLKLAFISAVAAFGVLRALAIRYPPPEGVPLAREEAPALLAMVDRLRLAVGGPAIDTIVIDDEFNAAVMQRPRLGVFGTRTTLILGLPLLQAFPEEEVAAIVAHELGHSAGAHGRWAGFVYGVRERWMQLADRLPDGLTGAALRRFFRWYGPWFNAYSFALARAQEYEADRASARATSPEVAGSALTRAAVGGDRHDRRWRELWSELPHADRPSRRFHEAALAAPDATGKGDAAALAAHLAAPTGPHDTHPSLTDRLTALGVVPDLPAPVAVSAASSLLGPLAAELASRFDDGWWEAAADHWREQHDEARRDAAERAALGDRIAAGDVGSDERLRYAQLTYALYGDDAAVDAYRALLAQDPGSVDGLYQLGALLLSRGDEAGIATIEAAVERSPALAASACHEVADFLIRAGRGAEAAPYLDRAAEAEARARMAAAEAAAIDETADLRPIGLSEAEEAALSEALRSVVGLAELWAARRSLPLGDRDQFVFVFRPTRGGDAGEVLDAVTEAMLPYADTLGVERSYRRRWLERRLKAVGTRFEGA